MKIKKDNLKALELRANAYYRLADHDMAMRNHREGLKFDPEHKGLKTAYKKTKKLHKAFKQHEMHLNAGHYDQALKEKKKQENQMFPQDCQTFAPVYTQNSRRSSSMFSEFFKIFCKSSPFPVRLHRFLHKFKFAEIFLC